MNNYRKVVSMRNTPRNRDKFRTHLETLGIMDALNSALTKIYECTEDDKQTSKDKILEILSESLGGYEFNQTNKELESSVLTLAKTNARMARYIKKVKLCVPKEMLPAQSDDESEEEMQIERQPDSTSKGDVDSTTISN